ncbi:hypothetical protein [Embleya sp. NPDC001921]
MAISPSGVPYADLGGATVAVDLATHELLSDKAPEAPVFTDNGWGIPAKTTGDVFVFPPR